MSAAASPLTLGAGSKRVFAAFRAYWQTHGRAPANRELQEAVGFTSTSTIHHHLRRLVAAGWIEPAERNSHRGYRPVNADPCPECGGTGRRVADAPDPCEGICQRCGCSYPVWFTPSAAWNPVMRLPDGADRYPFVCPTCFATLAEECGFRPTAWKLAPEEAANAL